MKTNVQVYHGIEFLTVLILLLFSSYGSYACFPYNRSQIITIKTGSSYYQECHCVESNHSIKDLKWLDINGVEIAPLRPGTQSNVYIEQRDNSLNLYISNISKRLSGEYKCVTNHNGRQNVLTYEVKAYDPLYFINTNEIQYLIRGEDSTITCEARGESVPLISWDMDEDKLPAIDDTKYEFTSTGLLVKNVTDSDGGTYKCKAFVLETGEDADKFIKVEIIATPVIRDLKAFPANTVSEGIILSIECDAEGTPDPDYMWYKIPDNEILIDQHKATWHQEKNGIIFDNVQASDRGTYECVASNKAGEDRRNITVEVLFPPKITEFSNITVREGKAAQIVCKATGRSLPEIEIIFEDEYLDIKQKNNSETENEVSFTILETNHTHAGFYLCNASNEVDFETEEIYLDVIYKPYFKNTDELIWGWNDKVIRLDCENDSNPPANTILRYLESKVQTEVPDQDLVLINREEQRIDTYINITISDSTRYGMYECMAKNIIGEARKIITLKKAFPPPVIQNITIIDLKASSALFHIKGPVNYEGPQIIGYTAQYDDTVSYNFSYAHINRTWALDRPFKIEKLKPATSYYIKFAAINEAGVGNWSEIIEFSTPNKSVPEKPLWLEDMGHISTNSNKQILRWNVPDSNGDPIDHYIFEYCAESNVESKYGPVCKKIEIEPTSELELNFLNYSSTYYIKLLAHNSKGYSDPLDKYIFMKEPEKLLSEPEDKTLLSTGALIGVIIVVVFISLLLLDLLLLCCKRKGVIAKCCYRKNKKRKENNRLTSRDKKGLLKDNTEVSTAEDTLNRSNNGHKEFEYDKTTGVITGKHSAV